jgi:phage FluMu protein Com
MIHNTSSEIEAIEYFTKREQMKNPHLRVLKTRTVLNVQNFYKEFFQLHSKQGSVTGLQQHGLFIKHSVSYSTLKSLKQLKLINNIKPGKFIFLNPNLDIENAIMVIRFRNLIQEKNKQIREARKNKAKKYQENKNNKKEVIDNKFLIKKELIGNLTKKSPKIKELVNPVKIEKRKYTKKKQSFFKRLITFIFGK